MRTIFGKFEYSLTYGRKGFLLFFINKHENDSTGDTLSSFNKASNLFLVFFEIFVFPIFYKFTKFKSYLCGDYFYVIGTVKTSIEFSDTSLLLDL